MSQLTKAPAQKPSSAPSTFTPTRRALVQRKCACGGTPGVDGECEQCRRKRLSLQRKANDGSALASVPPLVHDVINSPGRPLDAGTRDLMQARFGHDFSNVRVHTDSAAEASARAVNARAYTVGQDIAFDRGQYQPSTPDGQHLLAHELAHTLQQRGLQMSARDAQLDTRADSIYEREAERAADAVLAARAPIISASPRAAMVSRAATQADLSAQVQTALKKIGVEEMPPDVKNIEPGIRRFRVLQPFPLPVEKGPVKKYWEARAKEGGLESIVDVTGNPRSTLKQERPDSNTLRAYWLAKVGWSKDDAAKNWKAAGGDKASFDPPQAGGATCDMDHIVELQIGGNNIKENIQALDSSPNRSSGSQIRGFLAGTAGTIRQTIESADATAAQELENVILHFDSVSGGSDTFDPKWKCCQVEITAKTIAGAGAGKSSEGIEVEKYPIKAGISTDLLIQADEKKNRKKIVRIRESDLIENKSAATLIPGVLLTELHRSPTAKGIDNIAATLDTVSKTKLPITLEKSKGADFSYDVEQDGHLKLKTKNPNIQFTYRYLSKGIINHLDYSDEKGLSGRGTLTPSIPFLSKMKFGVEFSRDDFRITSGLDPGKIKSPFPGGKITKAELALILWPEFKPAGAFALEYAKGDKKMLDATIDIGLDAQGLMAKGKVNAYLPGVDKAEGNVLYSGGVWSGGVEIESTQIKLPYIKGGKVTVAFSEKTGIDAGGKVNLELPGGNTAEVSLEYAKSRWVFIGSGEFNLPRLDPVRVHVFYDGDKLIANGKTGFKLYGLKGRVDVTYTAKSGGDGRVTGKGELEIAKGKAKGKASITLHPSGKFSGEGSITYQISENLIATAGIVIDEKEKVTLKGALEFPKPIKLFEGIKGDKVIFKTGITIPIPGASIGPVGLVVKIDGSLGARYGIGPGELRGVKIEAAFNPLEDKPDPVLDMAGTLYIPAYAGIYGSIRGALAISVAVASVSGGLTVTASADLDGKVQASIKIHYEKSRFALDALAEIDAGLVLGLKLGADVKAEAGIGPFSVETKKVWNLANYRYDTGLKFGMKAPLHYATDEPFRAPSLDQIQWVTPQIDPQQMLKKLMA